jgi:hypothetical protein
MSDVNHSRPVTALPGLPDEMKLRVVLARVYEVTGDLQGAAAA